MVKNIYKHKEIQERKILNYKKIKILTTKVHKILMILMIIVNLYKKKLGILLKMLINSKRKSNKFKKMKMMMIKMIKMRILIC